MSVQTSHWLILGVKLNNKLNDSFYETHEKDILSYYDIEKGIDNEMGILYDGMGGEYIIAGMVLGAATEENGFGLKKIENKISDYTNYNKVRDWLNSKNLEGNIEYYLVTHCQ